MFPDRFFGKFFSFIIDCSLPIIFVVGLGLLLPPSGRIIPSEAKSNQTEAVTAKAGGKRDKEKSNTLGEYSEPAAIVEISP